MNHIFYSPLYEAIEQEIAPTQSEEGMPSDINTEIPDNSGTEDSGTEDSGTEDGGTEDGGGEQDYTANQDPNAQDMSGYDGTQNIGTDPTASADQQTPQSGQDDLVTKFQKYLLFLKLKDLQYKISLTNYKDNPEFKELTSLLKLILEFFSIFKYDQIFTLTNMLIEKFSKIKLGKK